MLFKLRIRHRLWLLIALALLILAGVSALCTWEQYRQSLAERRHKTLAVVDTAVSVVRRYGELAASGRLGQGEAQEAAKAAVRALRYDGDNYIFLVDSEHRVLAHGAKPQLEGTDAAGLKDANGVLLVVETVAAAKRGQNEFVDYLWPKNGSDKPQPKVSLGKLYAPWGWVVISGIYIDDIRSEFRDNLLRSAAIFGAAAALLLVFAVLIGRSITTPLDRLRQAMEHISRTGDLTSRAEIRGGGEPAEIAAVFNAMVDRFRGIVCEVVEGSHALLAASCQLVEGAGRIQHGSFEQSDAATSSAAAVEEITTSASHIADCITEVVQLSANARQQADDGARVVHQASREMLGIAESVTRATASVTRLGEDSKRISDIVAVIRDVADQTNLLALNAAIEAARAGEAGRGFSVVADEVRKLAERTATSTRQISETIGGIQRETEEAVRSIVEVSDQAHRGVAYANAAGEAVAGIDDSAGQVAGLINDIALGAQEQSSATQQIALNMARVSDMAQLNADATGEMADAARRLDALAKTLNASVLAFRV